MDENRISGESSAFSFGEGSFVSNEPTLNGSTVPQDASGNGNTVGGITEDTEGNAAEDLAQGIAENAAEDTTRSDTYEGIDTSEGATSFGDGSFETYEKAEIPKTEINMQAQDDTAPKSQNAGALGITAWILFFAAFPVSFVSLITMIVSIIVGGGVGAPVIGVMLIVPIASIVLGIVLMKKHRIGLKNIIGGGICLAFMLTMLLSSFGEIPDMDDFIEDDTTGIEFIESVESRLSIEFPEYYNTYYYEYEDMSMRSCDLYYEEAEFAELIETVKRSRDFKTNMPSTYIGLLPPADRSGDFDFCLVYNVTTNRYNELPAAPGKYKMICITVNSYYDESSGYVSVTEYELDYTTEFEKDPGFESDF